jgi:hypothetical protein
MSDYERATYPTARAFDENGKEIPVLSEIKAQLDRALEVSMWPARWPDPEKTMRRSTFAELYLQKWPPPKDQP